MAGSIVPRHDDDVPRHRAEIDIVWAMTADGMPWPVPATVAALYQSRGEDMIAPPRLYLRPPAVPPRGLSLAQAAREHLADLPPSVDAEDELRTLQAAKVKINRACKAGKIQTFHTGNRTLIDPSSFASWRLSEREKLLQDDE